MEEVYFETILFLLVASFFSLVAIILSLSIIVDKLEGIKERMPKP